MTTEEIAWFAGLFEGEGCREFWHRGNGSYGVALRIGMTDHDVIEKIRTVTGVGAVDFIPTKTENQKDIWRWTVTRREQVAALIRGMIPFLGERRRQQLMPLLEHCEQRLTQRVPTKKGFIEMNVPILPELGVTDDQ